MLYCFDLRLKLTHLPLFQRSRKLYIAKLPEYLRRLVVNAIGSIIFRSIIIAEVIVIYYYYSYTYRVI
jgi:hypothetical protein